MAKQISRACLPEPGNFPTLTDIAQALLLEFLAWVSPDLTLGGSLRRIDSQSFGAARVAPLVCLPPTRWRRWDDLLTDFDARMEDTVRWPFNHD